MNEIKSYSDDELKAELERREKEKKDTAMPKPLQTVDFEQLMRICADYIGELNENGYADEDYDHYIFECAIECIYGRDVWKWIRLTKDNR